MKRARLALMLGCLAAACQPQPQGPAVPGTVSLEQAKQITADFGTAGFAPPPRTIADITAVLDQYQPDAQRLAAAKEAADRTPPPDLSGAALAEFYYHRGTDAGNVGRIAQQLDDLRQAHELGTRSGDVDLSLILQALRFAEREAGNYANAIRYAEERVRLPGRGDEKGQLLGAYGGLVSDNIAKGDLAAAEGWLAELRERAQPDRTAKHVQKFNPKYTSQLAAAEAELLFARGRYAEAERELRSAIAQREQQILTYAPVSGRGRERAPEEHVEDVRDSLIGELAASLRLQGRLIEAEVEVRGALVNRLKLVGRYHSWTARTLEELARVVLEEGRAAEAEQLTRKTIDILLTVEATGSWSLAEARQTLASALVAQGRWTEALASTDQMLRALAGDQAGLRRFGIGDLDWTTALIKSGRGDAAVEMAERILVTRRAIHGEQHYDTAEARAIFGMALASTGARERALAELRAALPVLLAAGDLSLAEGEGIKQRRLHLILDAYIRLLAEIRGTPTEASARIDAAAEAFQLADAARGRSVQKALSAASARAAIPDPALAELARRAQDAAQQLAGLEGTLVNALAAPADQQDAAALAALRGHIEPLRQAHRALLDEIARRFPDYAELVDPKPATLEQARHALRPGEALFATYVSSGSGARSMRRPRPWARFRRSTSRWRTSCTPRCWRPSSRAGATPRVCWS
jgi:hypothetical protein